MKMIIQNNSDNNQHHHHYHYISDDKNINNNSFIIIENLATSRVKSKSMGRFLEPEYGTTRRFERYARIFFFLKVFFFNKVVL